MNAHGLTNLWPVVFIIVFVVSAVRKQLAGVGGPADAPASAQPEPAARRRLVPVPAARTAPPPAASSRAPIAPSMAETLPPEAAAAFPGLDLTLPGTPLDAPQARGRRRLRTPGGGPALGSAGWGADAIVALEILGPPVSLRAGATLGAPHAF